MNKCEELFDQMKIKPVLGVIPLNKDPELKDLREIMTFGKK